MPMCYQLGMVIVFKRDRKFSKHPKGDLEEGASVIVKAGEHITITFVPAGDHTAAIGKTEKDGHILIGCKISPEDITTIKLPGWGWQKVKSEHSHTGFPGPSSKKSDCVITPEGLRVCREHLKKY